jgi:hypothetical protein
VLSLCFLVTACGGATVSAPTPSFVPSLASGAAAASPIATSPIGLASQLIAVTGELRRSIEAWHAGGGTSTWPPPRSLVLHALTQQRIYGVLAQDPHLLRQVLGQLPLGLRGEAAANATAGAALLSLVHPSDHAVTFRTRAPLPAATLLGYYREAQLRFGVPWQILAAVNFIESRFGRVISNSSVGAQGPMQFISSTWGAYGLGGDVHDPRDAILGAANYLHASGAPADVPGSLYHYNPAPAYVRAVMLYAKQMTADPLAFYAYYNWQVFVLGPSGLEQVTGPGASA